MRIPWLAIVCVLLGVSGCRPRSTGATDGGTVGAGSASGAAGLRAPSVGGIVIDRPTYTLTYPTSWTLDDKDDDFDLDNYFSIDAPGSCHVQIFLYGRAIDVQKSLDGQGSKMKELVFKSEVAETPFDRWGALTGSGNEIRGHIKPVGRGRVRTFVHADPKHSIIASEFCFDEDLPVAQPGFDLIEASFRFR